MDKSFCIIRCDYRRDGYVEKCEKMLVAYVNRTHIDQT